MNTLSDSTILSIKTKKNVKALAQLRAKQLGMPLGTIVNAFLRNLGDTGEIHFTVTESANPRLAKVVKKMRAEIARGETDGPFTLDEAEAFLDSIPDESADKD
jgi:antitoxin component of RelBE/YafQ-DinJ toxin-antitoxin module